MGFGTLFLGYFFILNFPYCEFTDAIAAILMLYALFKLSRINEYFRFASFSAIVFTLFSLFELGIGVCSMFSIISDSTVLFNITALLRHTIVGLTTALFVFGIRDVANEVGLSALASKCTRAGFVTVTVYALSILLESASLGQIFSLKILAYASVFTILATMTLITFNLTCIYSAYMRICMPDEINGKEPESRFEFVNKFRRYEDNKSREYAEYKLEKLRKQKENNNKGKKK